MKAPFNSILTASLIGILEFLYADMAIATKQNPSNTALQRHYQPDIWKEREEKLKLLGIHKGGEVPIPPKKPGHFSPQTIPRATDQTGSRVKYPHPGTPGSQFPSAEVRVME